MKHYFNILGDWHSMFWLEYIIAWCSLYFSYKLKNQCIVMSFRIRIRICRLQRKLMPCFLHYKQICHCIHNDEWMTNIDFNGLLRSIYRQGELGSHLPYTPNHSHSLAGDHQEMESNQTFLPSPQRTWRALSQPATDPCSNVSQLKTASGCYWQCRHRHCLWTFLV